MPALYPFGQAVPITAQSMGVMLAGALLGAWRAGLALLLFIVLVAAGLPLLAGGAGGIGMFVTPRAGFLIGFPLAAFTVGWITERIAVPYRLLPGIMANVLGDPAHRERGEGEPDEEAGPRGDEHADPPGAARQQRQARCHEDDEKKQREPCPPCTQQRTRQHHAHRLSGDRDRLSEGVQGWHDAERCDDPAEDGDEREVAGAEPATWRSVR